MKKLLKIRIAAIFILSFFTINSSIAQWTIGTFPYLITSPGDQAGAGIISPQFQLCVAKTITIDTNIVYPSSINGFTGCYMLNDTTILHNYGKNNLFCGHLSGVSITTGQSNAFFGKNAGRKDSTGGFNTFMGHADFPAMPGLHGSCLFS